MADMLANSLLYTYLADTEKSIYLKLCLCQSYEWNYSIDSTFSYGFANNKSC